VEAQLESAALSYLARGWSVIPVEHRGKRPLVRWEHFQTEAPDAFQVSAWWHRWPNANVGIVTGVLSGLIVLDVDPRHGGERSRAQLEQQHGRLPHSVEALTGGGGRHIYFAHPGGVVRNRVELMPGIDIRGDGGLVVAPPSLHASGQRYAWAPRCTPDESEIAPLPTWLLALIRGETPNVGQPPSHWRELLRDGVHEGTRNNTIASITGHLLAHGIDPGVAGELLICWNRERCRPALSDEEVIRTVESITHVHLRSKS